MGRKVRCYFDVENPTEFLQSAADHLIDEVGYKVERKDLPKTLIIEQGNTAWTVIGTHQWSKTDRTLITSKKPDANGHNVEFLYDVSWLAINFRPQREIRGEIDELLENIGRPGIDYVVDYDTEV